MKKVERYFVPIVECEKTVYRAGIIVEDNGKKKFEWYPEAIKEEIKKDFKGEKINIMLFEIMKEFESDEAFREYMQSADILELSNCNILWA